MDFIGFHHLKLQVIILTIPIDSLPYITNKVLIPNTLQALELS